MKLTYYGYAPFNVATGRITVLGTGVPKIYRDLIGGFRNDDETIHVATDDYELKEVDRISQWYGDPMLEINLNGLFQRKLQTQLLKILSDQQTVNLTDGLQQLFTQILGDSYLLDVPLDIDEMPELSKLIKFSGIRIAETADTDVNGILETLIKTLVELNDQRTIVLTNVSHYLQVAQFKELSRLVADADLPVLIIEYSECRQAGVFEECEYHYIDSDFVLW